MPPLLQVIEQLGLHVIWAQRLDQHADHCLIPIPKWFWNIIETEITNIHVDIDEIIRNTERTQLSCDVSVCHRHVTKMNQ